MNRIPWTVLLALLIGVGLGLVYSWVISPLQVVDAAPIALRADFKDQYRSAIAAAYAANSDLTRAQARLSLLNDSDPVEALNAQAQRMLATGQSFEEADQVAALASALDQNGSSLPAATQTPMAETAEGTANASTSTIPPASEIPLPFTETPLIETAQVIETQATSVSSTPRPTRTAIPTLGSPFALTGQESICDSNLPDGLLQVLVSVSYTHLTLPTIYSV